MGAVAVSGLTGTITFVGGYTTLADGWRCLLTSPTQPTTGLSPANSHELLATAGNLIRGEGSYHCKLAVPETALFTGPYDDFPFAWVLRSTMTPRETTILGGTYATYVGGLIRSEIEMRSWLSDTDPLPESGTTGSTVLTAATGSTYTVTYVVKEAEVTVDVEDPDGHIVIIRADAAAFPTALVLPMPGVTGTATFLAYTLRLYTGTIFVTSVVCSVDRRRAEGGIDIGFVWSGDSGSA